MKYIKILALLLVFFTSAQVSFAQCTDQASRNISRMQVEAHWIAPGQVQVTVSFNLAYSENQNTTAVNTVIEIEGQQYYLDFNPSGTNVSQTFVIPLVTNSMYNELCVRCGTNASGSWLHDGCIVIVQPCC